MELTEFTRQNNLINLITFKTETAGAMVVCSEDSVSLRVNRTDYGDKEFTFVSEDEIDAADAYFVLKYSANGLMRHLDPSAPILYVKVEGKYCDLVRYQDIAVDFLTHTLVVKCPYTQVQGMKLAFLSKMLRSDFTIFEMYFCGGKDVPVMLGEFSDRDGSGKEETFSTISLDTQFNRHYMSEDENYLIEGGRFFTKEKVWVCGVPFTVKTEGNNVVYPAPGPAENDEIISNFGIMAKRRLCRPVSRDCVVEIPIGTKATEIYFILLANGLMYQRWGFGMSDPTILGGCQREVLMPLQITDVEFFEVEICYEDGRIDTAFPLSMTKQRHVVGSEPDAYVVPTDGSLVSSIRIHNKKLETDFSIAALTVNTAQERMFPKAVLPLVKGEIIPKKAAEKKKPERDIRLAGNILILKNGAISMEIDISKGMHLKKLYNVYTASFSFKASAMLQLCDEKMQKITSFELVSCNLQSESAVLVYRYQCILLTAIVTLAEADDIHFRLACENVGSETVQYGIQYPYFEGGRFDSEEEGWYFFPKCQNIDSNEYVNLYGESSPTFPMQFFDIYSKREQGGLTLRTFERELVVRVYGLTKNENGMEAYIEYPFMYGDIAVGETMTCSEAAVTAHRGDWRSAFALYKEWIDSWYIPHDRAQNKDWYRKNFWLLAEIPDFFETREFMERAPWYDQERKAFRFREILEEHKLVTGIYPDIMHLWGWTATKDRTSMRWGNWGEEDYAIYGSKEAFKEALHDVKDNMGIDVSLYVHPTLLSACYKEKAEKYFPEHRVQRSDGGFISIRDAFRMCHANEEWREEAISFYPRLYEDLGIPILYVDEFSLRIENRCYAPHHGHRVPSNLLQTDREFISELRKRVPSEVVLYGEYTAADVNARYIDCNITYQYVDTVMAMVEVCDWRYENRDDEYSRVYTNAYRFAFPKIVQLNLPMAMRKLSWHPQKFIFFNGEAVYDSFWDTEESEGTAFNVRAFKIKKKYADCFACDCPEMLVDTPSEAICANKFSGKDAVLYTLYNRAYSTYRGPLLVVLHEEGRTYLDVWNDCEMIPEIRDGYAILSGTIHAQKMGCIVCRGSCKCEEEV